MQTGILFFLALSLNARADLEPLKREGNPCQETHRIFCATMAPHTPSNLECMLKHKEGLPPKCLEILKREQALLDEKKEKLKRMVEACRDELAKFCQGVDPYGYGRRDCLDQHESKLSASCRKAVPSR